MAALAWVVNIGTLELHPFLHRARDLAKPTAVVFDLDPGEGADVFTCAKAALLLKRLLDQLGLDSLARVSGSKGLQVYVPLNTGATYEMTQSFALAIAQMLEQQHRQLVVSDMAKDLRRGKVFIDWSQNADHKTTVGVYSLRAKNPRPFVSAPITWEEVIAATRSKKKAALSFSPNATLQRLD